MPVTVIVRSASGDDAPSLTLDGPRIVIGRGAGSDIRLPDPSVSLRHASIRAQGTEYAVVDEGSMNGTWVGGIRLNPQTPRVVRTGELVRVGRVWLEIAIGQRAPTPDLNLATRDLAYALVERAMEAMGDDTVTRVRVAEGRDTGAELRIIDEGRVYVIGRAERCDLPLADEDASREHAAVIKRSGQILLRDLDSHNGLFLGESQVTIDRDVVWRSPTMVRLGKTVLALDEPVSTALSALEGADDEELAEADIPPQPAPSVQDIPVAQPDAPAPQSMGSAAPISKIAEIAAVPAPKARRSWTATDALVLALAVTVLAASLAGLFWVLR